MSKKTSLAVKTFLFIAASLLCLFPMMMNGTMINKSGDAEDIWKTITTLNSDEPYISYVLYKGVFSVYPYVWLYQLASSLGVNEFLFVMLYHSSLFAYVTVIAIPAIIEHLTGRKAAIWQRILFIGLSYELWKGSHALTQLMVDLPSCAFFFASLHCAVRIPTTESKRSLGLLTLSSCFGGMCATISGQYSIAAVCALIFAFLKFRSSILNSRRRRWIKYFVALGILVSGTVLFSLVNATFWKKVVLLAAVQGAAIAPGTAWMQRALIYMMDVGRYLDYKIILPRGSAIVDAIYGEQAKEIMAQAEAGVFSWTVTDYIRAVLQYPIDFLVNWFDRCFIGISVDSQYQCSVGALTLSYSLVFAAVRTAVKSVKTVKDFFSQKLWIVLAALTSIIPSLVMAIEMRHMLSFQGIVWGTALLSGFLPDCIASVRLLFHDVRHGGFHQLANRRFPWSVVIWIVFVLMCLAHIGSLYTHVSPEMSILFKF